jgi:undecaprenyl diphosphate synthase
LVVEPAPSAPPLPRLHVVPKHVAIIMDGNGRWAEARGLKRADGHRAGAEAIRPVMERFGQNGVGVLTLFGFSTENWGRPRPEVQSILRLGRDFIDQHLDELDEAGVQLRHLGDLDRLPGWLRSRVAKAVERTRENTKMILNLAFNYGGRADIVEAVQAIVREGVPAEDVTEELLSSHLTTAGLPDPDLLIRTGGEARISNFLVWQATYAEYYFTETLWPDFDAAAVDAALVEFGRRQRRFGLVPQGDEEEPLPDEPGA